jgi:hypothetical protein
MIDNESESQSRTGWEKPIVTAEDMERFDSIDEMARVYDEYAGPKAVVVENGLAPHSRQLSPAIR